MSPRNDRPRNDGRRRLHALLRNGAVVAVVVALTVKVGTDTVTTALAAITPSVLLGALALGGVTTVAAAARWCVVARGVGLDLPVRRASADVYRATFLNSVLPAGVLGDVHRALAHRGEGDGRGARAVVIERVAGQLVVVAACLAVLAATPALLTGALDGLVGIGTALGALVAALAALGAATMLARGPRATRVRVAVVGALSATAADLRAGLFSARTGPGVVVLSVIGFGGYVALFVLAARVAGVDVPLPQLLPLLVLSLLAMAVPLSVGGWGPREAVSTVAFGAAGLGAEQGLSVAVVYGVLSLVSCLPGAVVTVLGARRASRPTPAEPATRDAPVEPATGATRAQADAAVVACLFDDIDDTEGGVSAKGALRQSMRSKGTFARNQPVPTQRTASSSPRRAAHPALSRA